MAMITCLYTYTAIIHASMSSHWMEYNMPRHVPTLTGKAIPDSRGIAAEGHDARDTIKVANFNDRIFDMLNLFTARWVYPSGCK